MKKSKVWLIMCVCGLLLSGCNTKNTSDKMKETQIETTQPEDTQSGETKTEETSPSEDNTNAQTNKITEQEALAVALDHAGVEESNLTSQCIKKEWDDGKEVYDIEFYADGKEYDYEISADDGSVLQADFEIEDDFENSGESQSNQDEITEEDAKKIALEKVPGAEKIQVKKEKDDGRIVYEGEIYYENVEYEFKIDAATGEILSWGEDSH